MEQKLVYELLALIGGAMAGYGAMFVFLIKWMTRKNDDLLKIVLGNDRHWKDRAEEMLRNIEECVEGEHCAYGNDREFVHDKLREIGAACLRERGE